MTEPLPTICSERYEELNRRATFLLGQFIDGNKKDVADALKEMEPLAVAAVVSIMYYHGRPDVGPKLKKYFMEVA